MRYDILSLGVITACALFHEPGILTATGFKTNLIGLAAYDAKKFSTNDFA